MTFLPWERPVVIQIFDSDEQRLSEAAHIVAELGPDVIDINMGCSVSKIACRGAGAALLKQPSKIARIFELITRTASQPVSGKIRLGWDARNRNYLEVVQAMQDGGAAMVAVHGRTGDQGYSGQADWDAIAEIVAHARIPVIGNGDIQSVDDIERLKGLTGCAAVMIGRGAIGNPWIFQRRDRDTVPLNEKIAVIRRHFQLMEEHYGQDKAIVLMRKHLAKYSSGHPGIRSFRPRLVRAASREELDDLLDCILKNVLPADVDNF